MSLQQVPSVISNLRFVRASDLVLDHQHWKNPRTVTGLDDISIAELGDDIKKRGLQVPLLVQKIKAVTKSGGDFSNLVIEGQRRGLAIYECLPKDFEVAVIDRSPDVIELTPEVADKLMLDMLSVASRREGLSAYELSEVASRLRDRDHTHKEIGKAIGRDESWVSKILTARKNATPELMKRWRKNEVTEEQFRDLATVKDPVKQNDAAKEVVKAREDGDNADARHKAKELAQTFKNEQKTSASTSRPAPVVKGPQATFDDKKAQPSSFDHDAKPSVPPPPKRNVPSKVSLEEIVALADRRPPTSDQVKGIVIGVKHALGILEQHEFGKAWDAYIARIDGSGKAKKAAKKTKAAAKPKKAATAKKPAKPTKKAKKK